MALPKIDALTEELAIKPDNELKQMALLHKADPYVFPLIVAEDMRRKKIRAANAGAQYTPQPKVVDKEISAMGATPMPEDVGIAQLPAPNMARMADGGIAGYDEGGMVSNYPPGEVVMRMAAGGVAHFDKGGRSKQDIMSMVLEAAERYGIDPDVAVRLVKAESGFNPDAVSPKKAVGLTQLMADTAKDMGISPEDRKDPAKNLDAGFKYLRKQLDKYGDYGPALAAFNWGPTNVDKHLTKHEGRINPNGLPKETADYLTKIMPGSVAQAATPTAPQALPPGTNPAIANIPGYVPESKRAPEAPKQEAGFLSPEWFQEKAESLGFSKDTGRQVFNTLMAPTPLAPAAQVPKAGGIAALGARVYQRFSPAARAEQEGIKALQEAKAVQQAAADAKALQAAKTADMELQQAAQMAGAMPGEARLAGDASRAVEAAQASRVAQVPSAAEKIQAASIAREAGEAATIPRLAQVAQGTQQVAQIPSEARAVMGGGAGGARPIGDVGEDMGAEGDYAAYGQEFDPMSRLKGATTEEKKEMGTKMVKEATAEAEKTGGIASLFENPVFLFGLRLMGESGPNFLQNVGRAGSGTAADMAALRKSKLEERKAATEEKYYGALSKRAEALARTEGLTGSTQLAYYLGKGDTTEERVSSGYATIQAADAQMKQLGLDEKTQEAYWKFVTEQVKQGEKPTAPRAWAEQNRQVTALRRAPPAIDTTTKLRP